LSAQIDYLVITRKINFVIECKNLYGNIEINAKGDFIRTIKYGDKFVKEGIYSPITQNQRHMELIKKLLLERKTNILTRAAFNKFFPNFYRAIIVLANPKTILNNKNAEKSIKENVIRADMNISV